MANWQLLNYCFCIYHYITTACFYVIVAVECSLCSDALCLEMLSVMVNSILYKQL